MCSWTAAAAGEQPGGRCLVLQEEPGVERGRPRLQVSHRKRLLMGLSPRAYGTRGASAAFQGKQTT